MKPAAPLAPILPLLLSLAPFTAQCFYNPSTGRWLNRDPIEESGGANVYVLAVNQPITQSDKNGQDMILREYFFQLLKPPSQGTNAGLLGQTWFQSFAPWVHAYHGLDSSCCWKIALAGHADLYSWWVKDTRGPDGMTAKDHEMLHVQVGRDVFHGFVASASDYIGTCLSKAKADCFANVITGVLKAAYGAHYDTENMKIDCRTYGKYCDKLQDQENKENSLWQQLSRAEDQCASQH
jgi:hypothetical protein